MFEKLRRLIVLIFRKAVRPFSGRGIGKFYPIGFLYRFLFSFFKISNDIFEVQESKMFLDSIDSLGVFTKGIHEPFTTEFFKKQIKNGDVILDIGAHIGYYTLLFAKLAGEKGKVYAFEPHPGNFALLKKNVEINGYQNVVLESKAVSDKSGKNRLFISKKGSSVHSIFNIHNSDKSIEIESIKLDDYFKNYNGRIDWIKIDIEGAELSALQGMPLLLEKNENVKIVTEFAPCCLEESGIRIEEYFRTLKNFGFHIYNLNETRKKIETCGIAELLQIYTLENRDYTNLLCSRGEII